jgi:hypothetical protein
MEVRLTLDDELMRSMMEKAGVSKATDLTKEAMSLLYWAIGEAAAGRVILSADEKGSDIQRLATPALARASLLAKK